MKREPFHNPATPMRSGYTTGACAAAAAKGAALMLAHQMTVREVSIELPGGVSATFQLSGQSYSPATASCFVVKDAGDDPDITNGAEVHARISLLPPPLTGGGQGVGEHATSDGHDNISPTLPPPRQGVGDIVIEGGKGIGRVTKPGLAVPPGEWAINPVPRRMIEEAVRVVLSSLNPQPSSFGIIISIPDGEERAKKTLNARLGIIGGLSILGTTGIVRPVSAKAWTDTIDAALDVSRACGCRTVVLSTGRTSELAAQNFLRRQPAVDHRPATLFDLSPPPPAVAVPTWLAEFPEEAFVMMGDHIAYALQACRQRGFDRPVIACQFAKLLKIACGYENTHAAASELDLERLLAWGREGDLSGQTLATISRANTAREIAIACSFDRALLDVVFRQARSAVLKHAPEITAQFLVADYSGNCIFDSR